MSNRTQLQYFPENAPPGATHYRPLNICLSTTNNIVPDQALTVQVRFGVRGMTTAQEVRILCVRFAANALLVQGVCSYLNSQFLEPISHSQILQLLINNFNYSGQPTAPFACGSAISFTPTLLTTPSSALTTGILLVSPRSFTNSSPRAACSLLIFLSTTAA